MKHFISILALGFLLAGSPLALRAADANEELQLIAVLQSSASLQDKDAACARLKRIGTDQSVAALASLLTDEALSQSARYALEPMSSPQAGRALVAALDKTKGPTQVGIINSIGLRRDAQAVPPLARLLADTDPQVAAASAGALGRIASPSAIKALQKTLAHSTPPVHAAIIDALLRCANHLLEVKDRSQALAIFKHLYKTERQDFIRVAAYRGVILASGERAPALMTQAITGEPSPSQTAALQLVRRAPSPAATTTFAGLLPRVSAPLQISLIGSLAQRDDPAATPAIAAMAASTNADVRIAAINALATIGDGSVVPLLLKAAASGTEPEQAAARWALLQLRRGNPTEALLARLATAASAEQLEAVQALGNRADSTAVPKLLELAKSGSDDSRSVALQALALLGDSAQISPMVSLVLDAKSDAARTEAANVLNQVCQRIVSKRARLDVAPLIKGLQAESIEARVALLPICSGIVDPQIQAVLRAAVAASEPRLRAGGVRALAQTRDPELLADLRKIACDAPEKNLRILSIRGCVRLMQQEPALVSNADRIETLKAILASSPAASEKRTVLSGLSVIGDSQAIELVMPLLQDPEVQAEAGHAAVQLSAAVSGADSKLATATLNKVLSLAPTSAIREEGEAALKQVQAQAAYITVWQVAGPYRQQDKNYAALFDLPFPPETAEAQSAKWQTLSLGTDPTHPWVMDLLKSLNTGEQCVAYARTWIYSAQNQAARLEIGSDDGFKLWLNGTLMQANNATRALQPGSDKVDVNLKAGWNPLLLKITQNNQGWAFCVRCLKPDGSAFEDLRIDPEHQ